MNREHRKQIKQDELRTGFGHAMHWVGAHRDEVRVTAIAVAVLALAAVGFGSYRSHRLASAEKALDDALLVYHASVAGEPDAAQAGGTVYATAGEKYQKAAAAFTEVGKRHGSTAAGRRARYYAALANLDLGKTAEAEAELKDLATSGGDPLVRDLARLAIADLARGTGRFDQAAEGYRKLIDDKDAAVPRDHALMQLASGLEAAKRSPEALASYRRLIEEFPASVYAPEARRRIDYLGQQG